MTDELDRFTHNSRADVHVLLSLDRNPPDGWGSRGRLPISRNYGGGRVFYTALGHREEVWQDPRYQQHLLGGLRWALGG
ncbi:MAG: ThuA domain-containing protein [Acidobacteriota bacterium]